LENHSGLERRRQLAHVSAGPGCARVEEGRHLLVSGWLADAHPVAAHRVALPARSPNVAPDQDQVERMDLGITWSAVSDLMLT